MNSNCAILMMVSGIMLIMMISFIVSEDAFFLSVLCILGCSVTTVTMSTVHKYWKSINTSADCLFNVILFAHSHANYAKYQLTRCPELKRFVDEMFESTFWKRHVIRKVKGKYNE
eukprot:154549_1